jgi:methionyl aminopeptidase
MIEYKTTEEIKIMQHGGHILADVLGKVMDSLKPGMTELEADQLAERLIREQGGEPGFQKVKGYRHTICVSTNDVVVHGIPGSYKFKAGDVVGIDCGVFYKGFHTDMSETRSVQSANFKVQNDIEEFLNVGKKALNEAIKVAVLGNRIGHISKKIQDIVEGKGYAIVRSLIGHGVGRDLHEDPEVPGYVARPLGRTPLLKEGMTIAVEVIYNMGGPEVMLDRDGWTIRTEDGALAGLYERTIAITKSGPLMLTI